MKVIKRVLFFSAVLLFAVSCKKDKVSFDPQLLYGESSRKWVSGSEFWRYNADGTGVTWDTSDDVTEEEAQPFKWEYNDDDNSLTHIHWMEMTQQWTVPRVYTVTKLDDNNLVYKDNFGKVYSFVKTN